MPKPKRRALKHKNEIINTSPKMESHGVIWLFSIFELLFLTIMIVILMGPVKLMLTGNRSDATVVGLASRVSSSKNLNPVMLYTPIVEFYTQSGEKVTTQGSYYAAKSPFKIGDKTKVVYRSTHLKDTQIVSWTELPLIPAGLFFGFFLFTLMIWISFILIDGNHTYDDPLGLLPWMISHFQLNPVRFPILFILSLAIPSCILGTYILTKEGIDLRANGIKVIGHVDEQDDTFGAIEIYNKKGGIVYVTFEDETGFTVSIKTALHRPYSRLKPGEAVEIIYPVNKPQSAILNVWSEIFLLPVIFGLFTLMLLFVLWWILKNSSSL